jgi:hypothetical protein
MASAARKASKPGDTDESLDGVQVEGALNHF